MFLTASFMGRSLPVGETPPLPQPRLPLADTQAVVSCWSCRSWGQTQSAPEVGNGAFPCRSHLSTYWGLTLSSSSRPSASLPFSLILKQPIRFLGVCKCLSWGPDRTRRLEARQYQLSPIL